MRNQKLNLGSALLAFFLSAVAVAAQSPNAGQAPIKTNSIAAQEDWNTLSLTTSHLKAEPPILGEKDQSPLYSRELLELKWRFGDPIDLYVIRPKGVAKPPVILYLYTYPSESDRFRNDHFCGDVTRDGFAAVGFVSALTGQRYTNRPMKEWFVSELQEALVKSVHDVQMILNYLSTRDDLDLTRVGMFGEGSGGTIAILAATTDPRIKGVDVLDPWGDWPEWMAQSKLIPDQERANYLKPDFLKNIASFDPVDKLSQLKTPLRIQQVADDSVTPPAAKKRIDTAAQGSSQIVHYDNTMEFFRTVTGGRLFQWLKEQIRAIPSAQQLTSTLGANSKASALNGTTWLKQP